MRCNKNNSTSSSNRNKNDKETKKEPGGKKHTHTKHEQSLGKSKQIVVKKIKKREEESITLSDRLADGLNKY